MKSIFCRMAAASWLAALGANLALAQTTVTFQQGVDGYTGTFDRRISMSTNVNGADVDTTGSVFWIDGDPNDSDRSDLLIRFDDIIGVGAIPPNAIILDAQLTLTTTSTAVNSNSQSNEAFNVYRLTKAFDTFSTLDGDFGDNDELWTPFEDGVEPEDNEADLIVGSFDRLVYGTRREVDLPYSADVTRAVQSWVNGEPNFGLAVVSDHVNNDDGWSVHSTGSSLVEARPKLTVTYTTEPNLEVVELQQGLNGYTGTTDRFLKDANSGFPNLDGSTVSEAFLDGSNGLDSFDDPYMIRFDLAGLPPASQIVKAELVLMTGITSLQSDSRSTTPGVGYNVHQLLVPFSSTTSAYEDFAGDFNAMLAANEIAPQVAQFADIDEAELVKVDVTSVVTNWLINGAANHGFYIGANGTSNGWQIFASGGVDSDLRPLLRILLKTATDVPSAVNSAIYHAGFSGAGTPPWNAIDDQKQLLQRGATSQAVSLSNLTNSSRGINGIVLDFDRLNALNDLTFEYKMSPTGAFDEAAFPITSWVDAPPPSAATLYPAEGTGGSDRVLIQWANNSIENRYLCVRVLFGSQVIGEYYLGHLRGETTGGTPPTPFTVAFADITPIRADVGQTVAAGSDSDIDKNGTVSFADISSMRGNVGAQLTQITVPAF